MPQERRVVIIAGGEIQDLDFLRSRIGALSPEAVICADSGARHLQAIGMVPRMIVGDMDSLPGDLVDAFAAQGVEIRRYRAEKDETDAELAFSAACELRPTEIWVFGALGYRLDHTLANLSLLLKGAERNIPVTLLDKWCEVFLITGNCTIVGTAGQTVSLLPLFGKAAGVSLSGFQYPLEKAVMSMTSPFGISNRLSTDQATVSLESGSLVAIRYFQQDTFLHERQPMSIPRVLTIAGSDSGGGAGIQADLKTITVMGGFGMSVITALTAQNTLGVHGIHEIPPDFVAAQFDAVASDIGVDAAKTGMLASPDILMIVAEKIRQYRIEKLVVDPVMVAKGGTSLIRKEAREILSRELLPLALVATPNIPEAEVLTDVIIASPSDMKVAAKMIYDMGAKNVVIKGGHLVDGAVDLLYDGHDFYEFPFERIPTKDTHGTGCTFAAAIATGLAKGESVLEAVKAAEIYIASAIRNALRLGAGHGPTNHLAPLLEKQDAASCKKDKNI